MEPGMGMGDPLWPTRDRNMIYLRIIVHSRVRETVELRATGYPKGWRKENLSDVP